MSHNPTLAPCWSTSSLGAPAEMSEQDNQALGAHLNQCALQHGPLQVAGHAAVWLHTQLAARTLTTLAVSGALVVAGWSVF